jgi:acyl-coenzyme A thioesterase PaaI-like protein
LKTLQPNSQHCFVCGVSNPFGLKLRFYDTSPGEVSAECLLTEQYQGYPGVVHGGVVAAMLDEVAGRSLMGVDPPRFMYTARLEIHYRKNVPVGQPLHLVGTAGKSRQRAATATSAIYDSEGSMLAEAEVLLVNLPAEAVAEVDLAALGWKVYPEGG